MSFLSALSCGSSVSIDQVQEQIKELSATFDFDTTQYTKAFQDNQKLADSSIYTYYTRIAEPFLTHALQYIDADDDINDLLNKIYQQIISNTRLADEVRST